MGHVCLFGEDAIDFTTEKEDMDANVVPVVRNFPIHTETVDDHSIPVDCVTTI